MAGRAQHSLSAREQAMVHGGGAATLPIGEWVTLLTQVVDDHQSTKRINTRVSWIYKFGAGATLISALGHLAPAPLAEGFRLPLIGAVIVTLLGLGLAWRFRKVKIVERFEHLELPLLQSLAKLKPDAHLYLALAKSQEEAAISSALFAFKSGHALLYSLSPKGPKRSQLEVGLVTTRAIDTQDPSVSGITRQAAALAQAQGNPFSSLEMVALREAHELQARWAKLERFSKKENAMPQIEKVLAEEIVHLPLNADAVSADKIIAALRTLGLKCGIEIFS